MDVMILFPYLCAIAAAVIVVAMALLEMLEAAGL